MITGIARVPQASVLLEMQEVEALVQPACHAGDDDGEDDALDQEAHGAVAGLGAHMHGAAAGRLGLVAPGKLFRWRNKITHRDPMSCVLSRGGGDDAFQMLDAATHLVGLLGHGAALARGCGRDVNDIKIASEGLGGAIRAGLAADVRSHKREDGADGG